MSTAPAGTSINDLLEQGDEYAGKNDTKAAAAYYQAALKIAQQGFDPAMRGRLEAAATYVRHSAECYKDALRAIVRERADPAGPDRLQHAVDMLVGERELFLQGPSAFYFPYLANRQFFEREEFGWVAALRNSAFCGFPTCLDTRPRRHSTCGPSAWARATPPSGRSRSGLLTCDRTGERGTDHHAQHRQRTVSPVAHP